MAAVPREHQHLEPCRVVIVGGGVAALEALLALSETARGHVTVQLVSPDAQLTYRPLAVAEPFGITERRVVDLRAAAQERGARFVSGRLTAVEPRRNSVVLDGGERLEYDALLLATGAHQAVALPGALTFGSPAATDEFRAVLSEIAEGELTQLVFAVPDGVRWPLPIYELALMTAAFAARRAGETEIHLVTPEPRPLDVFGPAASAELGRLLDRAGVSLHCGQVPVAVHDERLLVTPIRAIPAQRVVAMPRLIVPAIPGLPRTSRGFIPVNEFGLVDGLSNVYAAGDVTWHPVKQGGLATQQADAAASAIAAAAGAPVMPEPFEPVLRGILLTGGAPEYLRGPNGQPGAASRDALWWPPAKVAGRYLGPFLAGDERLDPLRDVHADHHPGLDLALDAAEAAAGWGDYESALRWLEVVEQLNVVLPEAWAERRRHWRAAAGESAG